MQASTVCSVSAKEEEKTLEGPESQGSIRMVKAPGWVCEAEGGAEEGRKVRRKQESALMCLMRSMVEEEGLSRRGGCARSHGGSGDGWHHFLRSCTRV